MAEPSADARKLKTHLLTSFRFILFHHGQADGLVKIFVTTACRAHHLHQETQISNLKFQTFCDLRSGI